MKWRKRYGTILFVLILISGSFCLIGCSDKDGSKKAEDGRRYDGTIEAQAGESVETTFFDITVEQSSKTNIFQFDDGLYQADNGKTYLEITLTIKNIYEKDLPMSITDFTLDFDGNPEDGIITGYGKADLRSEEYMENIFTLKKGESITKKILFTVEDKEEYTLRYREYYEDGFRGNQFLIHMNPKAESSSSSEQTESNSSSEEQTESD